MTEIRIDESSVISFQIFIVYYRYFCCSVPLSTGEWLLSFWSSHLEARRHKDPRYRPLEAVVEEGELIFVPHGYWHMVVNLDDCIAITHNYVSTSNLKDCLRFLRENPDQISGVRDRPGVAVEADSMYETFKNNLREILSNETIELAIKGSKNVTKRSLMEKTNKKSSHKKYKTEPIDDDNDEGSPPKLTDDNNLNNSLRHGELNSHSPFSFSFLIS